MFWTSGYSEAEKKDEAMIGVVKDGIKYVIRFSEKGAFLFCFFDRIQKKELGKRLKGLQYMVRISMNVCILMMNSINM